MQYETELKGSIIISVDNTKAVNETVSKLLNNKDENQSIRIELINKTEKSSESLSNLVKH
jgi:hypothetical protein